MVAVADYTLPANLLINEREASLLRVLKLIKTSHGVTNQYVLRGGHSVLSDWKNDVVEELSFTWKSATQGHRIHFARAMLWWNEWLQSQSAKSMEVSQMPPPWVLRGWLEGKAMEQKWDAHHKTWLPYDPVKDASLAKAPPLARISDRTAQRYGLDKAVWERSANARF